MPQFSRVAAAVAGIVSTRMSSMISINAMDHYPSRVLDTRIPAGADSRSREEGSQEAYAISSTAKHGGPAIGLSHSEPKMDETRR